MKCKDFIVYGKLPDGRTMEVKCDISQIAMVKAMLKQNGISDTKIKPDFNYGKAGK